MPLSEQHGVPALIAPPADPSGVEAVLGQGSARGADRMTKPVARRTLKSVAVVIGLATASVGGYGGALIYTDNFHTVSTGILYRSAQMSQGEFEAAIRRHGIKSILNLRGAHPGEPWYDGEIRASREAGIAHYDYPLSARRVVGEDKIAVLLEILRAAPKPLLIHCKSGADRAGLVAALFRFAIGGASPAQADRQLSLVYGHFPYLTSRTVAMDESYWAFVRHSADAQIRR
jgi:protein tyrosine phosphatase (PTP) superfamily phosphohydrolase (DUF442 family)